MGSVRERVLDVDARIWLCLGIGQLVGLLALPMWSLELLRQLWVGLGSRDGRLRSLVGRWRLLRAKHRVWFWRISPSTASTSTPTHRAGRVGLHQSSDHRRESEALWRQH